MNPLEAQLKHIPEENIPAGTTSTEIVSKERPVLLTLLCGFFFVRWIHAVITILLVILLRPGGSMPAMRDLLSQVGPIFLGTGQTDLTLILGVVTLATIVGVIGIFLMYRWSVVIYAAATIALMIMTIQQIQTPFSATVLYSLITVFLINIALIVVAGMNFKRMK